MGHALSLQKNCQTSFTTFSVIQQTDRQTNRQTDTGENITSFFGGGNKAEYTQTTNISVFIVH